MSKCSIHVARGPSWRSYLRQMSDMGPSLLQLECFMLTQLLRTWVQTNIHTERVLSQWIIYMLWSCSLRSCFIWNRSTCKHRVHLSHLRSKLDLKYGLGHGDQLWLGAHGQLSEAQHTLEEKGYTWQLKQCGVLALRIVSRAHLAKRFCRIDIL